MTFRMDIEMIITAVQERPEIFDKKHPHYSDKNIKNKKWIEICEQVFTEWAITSEEEIMKKGKAVAMHMYIYRSMSFTGKAPKCVLGGQCSTLNIKLCCPAMALSHLPTQSTEQSSPLSR